MELKKGMTIHVADDLSTTKRLWGMNDHMRNMKGTIRKVHRIAERISSRTGSWSTCIYIKDEQHNEWAFALANIVMIDSKPKSPQKPILFDIKHIDTGE